MAWMLWRLFLRKKHAKRFAEGGAVLQLKRAVRSLCYLFNLHTLVVLALAGLAVYICHREDWRFVMDFSMVSTGTVFPLTFTLAQAFTRRERATSLIANLKASLVGLYFMHRDWQQANYTNGQLGNNEQATAVTAKALLLELALSIRRYLTARTPYESLAEGRLTAGEHHYLELFEGHLHLSDRNKAFRAAVQQLVESDPAEQLYHEVYKLLSRLSVINEKLTIAAGYTRGGEGGLSRTNQYMRYIISNIEELRTIKQYRTPAMMRHAVAVLIHIFAILLAPYWAHFCNSDVGTHCVAGYASAAAYTLITLLLFHVQQDLEDCLAETGLDDVFFVPKELDTHLLGGQHVLCSTRSSNSDLSHMLQEHAAALQGYGRLGFRDNAPMQRQGSIQGSEGKHLRTIPSDKALHNLELHPLITNLSHGRSSHHGQPHAATATTAVPLSPGDSMGLPPSALGFPLAAGALRGDTTHAGDQPPGLVRQMGVPSQPRLVHGGSSRHVLGDGSNHDVSNLPTHTHYGGGTAARSSGPPCTASLAHHEGALGRHVGYSRSARVATEPVPTLLCAQGSSGNVGNSSHVPSPASSSPSGHDGGLLQGRHLGDGGGAGGNGMGGAAAQLHHRTGDGSSGEHVSGHPGTGQSVGLSRSTGVLARAGASLEGSSSELAMVGGAGMGHQASLPTQLPNS